MGDIAENTATTNATTSTALAVRPVTVAHSDVSIYDTAAFDQMGRIARAMAAAWMMPETITNDKDGPLPIEVCEARALMIVCEARDMEIPPQVYAAHCAFVKGKLIKEGKLVNAIIEKRTGVKLQFRFGKWVDDHIEFAPQIPDPDGQDGETMDDPSFFHGIGDLLAVRAFDPKDRKRFVDGYVGGWKTTGNNSPWSKASDHRRQLRYRAAPEWGRAYESGAVLGIYTEGEDFEGEIFGAEPRKPRGTAAKLTAGRAAAGNETTTATAGPEGFDAARMTAEADTAGGGGANDDAVDAEVEEIKADTPAAETTEKAAEADGADTRAVQAAMNAESLARISPHDEPADGIAQRILAAWAAGEPITMGHAEPGEVYLIAGEGMDAKGRRLSYKDGERGDLITGKAAGKLKAYAIHAPSPEAEGEDDTGEGDGDISEPCEYCGAEAGEECKEDCPGPPEGEEAEGDGDHEAPLATATDGAQAAEPEPATSETVTPASSDGAGQAEASGPSAPPAAETPPAADPEPGSFLASLRPMTSWLQIKAAWIAMNKTPEWLAAAEADRNEIRREVFAEIMRVKNTHRDPIDWGDDVTVFGIWLATMKPDHDGAMAVQGTFDTLKRQPAWSEKLKPEQRAVVEARVEAFMKAAGK